MASIPNVAGWYEIPGTKLRAVAPPGPYPPDTSQTFASNQIGIYAYSGGFYDWIREQLGVIGGGHQDYFGNEYYAAVDVPSLSAIRLTNPTTQWPPPYDGNGNLESFSNGTPGSRHTYNSVVHMPNVDKLYMQGGSRYGQGGGSLSLWLNDFKTRNWSGPLDLPNKPNSGADIGTNAQYDPVTGCVFHRDATRLYRYDPLSGSNGAYTLLHDGQGITYTMSSVLDPIRRLMFIMGSGFLWKINISGQSNGLYNAVAFPTTGGGGIIGTGYPGMAWDPVSGNIVCWNGGNTVYILNPDSGQWTTQTFPGGPPRTAQNNWTFGRWRYSPRANAFLVSNHPDDNAYAFKLSTSSQPSNRLVKINRTASTQTNMPTSEPRSFPQGMIPQFAQAVINGTAVFTQCDVKTRHSDGSVDFAIMSFVMPTLPANDSVSITFQNQSTGNNTGFLTAAGMLAGGFDFEGEIRVTSPSAVVRSAFARTMLQNGHFEYWLQGSVCTAVVLRDKSATRTYDMDFGNGRKALHPRFEAWFYPSNNKVWLRASIENSWASSVTPSENVSYSVNFLKGQGSPTSFYSESQFTHLWRSVHTKNTWLGTAPALTRNIHNTQFLASAKVIPNYDVWRQTASEQAIASMYAAWLSSNKSFAGTATGVGNYLKLLEGQGANYWIGWLETWSVNYLLSEGDPRMLETLLGNAELGCKIPVNFREADASAGLGDFFDDAGTVPTQGKVISVNARRTISLGQLGLVVCSGQSGDQINDGSGEDPSEPGGWQPGYAHKPAPPYLAYLLTGQHFFMERVQNDAALAIAYRVGCVGNQSDWRQGSSGYFNEGQDRAEAWAFRDCLMGWRVSPDGTPEKAYFLSKLQNNIALHEGSHGVAASYPAKSAHYTYGQTNRIDPADTGWGGDGLPPAPFHFFRDRGPGFVQSPPDGPIIGNGSILTAMSPFEMNFLIISLGMCKAMGHSTQNLLTYLARLPFNIVMNGNSVKYLIDAYRWPCKLTATGTWIQTMAQFLGGFATPIASAYNVPTGFNSTDHGYGLVAQAAISFLADITVDGYNGSDVFTKLLYEHPNQRAMSEFSPKYNMAPLVITQSVVTPTVPSPPLNLHRV